MKKLLVIALGLGIALGTISFAQDTTKDGDKKTQKKTKKKKTADETKSWETGMAHLNSLPRSSRLFFSQQAAEP